MERKKECEIVQDLLWNYQDNVLNKTSKRLVEEHLIQCENCCQKLQEMKEETKQEKNKQKKEIDYLKKIKRKARIKSVLGIAGGIFIVFFMIYLYRFCIIHKVTNQYNQYLQANNIYQETTQLGIEGEGAFVTKNWYKDGKYKKEIHVYTEEKGWQQLGMTEYGEIGSSQKIRILEETKKVIKENWPWEQKKSSILCFPGNLEEYRQNFWLQLGAPFFTSIKVDDWHVGREYYIFKQDRTEIWLDKELGLPIRKIDYQAQIQYYPHTTIEKTTEDSITKYHYEFNQVKEEDVQVPNLTGYEVTEDNSMIENIQGK